MVMVVAEVRLEVTGKGIDCEAVDEAICEIRPSQVPGHWHSSRPMKF